MKKTRYSVEQIVRILREADTVRLVRQSGRICGHDPVKKECHTEPFDPESARHRASPIDVAVPSRAEE
jgi:hypothetical protein